MTETRLPHDDLRAAGGLRCWPSDEPGLLAEQVTAAVCGGYTAMSGSSRIDPPVPCRDPVRERVTAGCIHEHVGCRDLCAYHADEAVAGRMLCGDCLNADASHRCHLRVLDRSLFAPRVAIGPREEVAG